MFNPYGSFLWQCRSDKSFDFLSNSLFIQLRCLNTKDKRKKKDVLRYTGYSPFFNSYFLTITYGECTYTSIDVWHSYEYYDCMWCQYTIDCSYD